MWLGRRQVEKLGEGSMDTACWEECSYSHLLHGCVLFRWQTGMEAEKEEMEILGQLK